jgi:hypothetical protein
MLTITCRQGMAAVRSVDATASGNSTPDITSLSLEASKSPLSSSRRKRPAESDLHPYQDRLLQPDSRPISQEQLAAEIKSIYAGLTMVETKCIHVDRAQAAALQEGADPNQKSASDHWPVNDMDTFSKYSIQLHPAPITPWISME